MSGDYRYSIITVTTRHGVFKTRCCDYYIQDGMLTVIRAKEVKESSYDDSYKYKACEKHYPMEHVVEIECMK